MAFHPDAILWERILWLIWSKLEADYAFSAESPELEHLIRALMSNPDNQTYIETFGKLSNLGRSALRKERYQHVIVHAKIFIGGPANSFPR